MDTIDLEVIMMQSEGHVYVKMVASAIALWASACQTARPLLGFGTSFEHLTLQRGQVKSDKLELLKDLLILSQCVLRLLSINSAV